MGIPIDDLYGHDLLRRRRFEYDVNTLRELMEPFIEGIEVTQGIQYYRAALHLTDGNDRGSDNSVRLVANKPAWTRVYVRSSLLSGQSYTLSGELEIQRPVAPQPLWQGWATVATLSPRPPGTVVPQSNPNYAITRSTIGLTMNFIIPQDLMFGDMRLIAKIWESGRDASQTLDTHETVLDVTLRQTLRLRGVMISYNGPDPTVNPTNPPTINLAAPTVADLQATAALTLTMNPVRSQAVFSSAGTLPWGIPLTGPPLNPGGCSTEWLQLNGAVAGVRTSDGNRTDVIYYGLLPNGTPMGPVGGCEWNNVSTGPNGRQDIMAHEVGHGAGLQHGPCGTPGDPNYPAYEPYDAANTPMARLGEYGLDINNGTIHPPGERDYMSYCGPIWISLYHHARLIDNDRLNPETVGRRRWVPPELVDPFLWPWEYIPDPPYWERHPGDLRMKAERIISIIGLVDEVRQIQVQSVMRVLALPAVPGGRETSFVAQLIGADGNVVASAPVMRLAAYGCGCHDDEESRQAEDKPFVFQAILSDVEPGSALRIVQKGEEGESQKELWMRGAPGQEPQIRGFSVSVARGQGNARWEAQSTGEQPLEFALQFSKDGGRSWNSLGTGIKENNHTFPLVDLPSGEVIFRLLAHDGFFTSAADSRPVTLPKRPPVVSILHPQQGPELIAGQPMRLWAAVSTATGEPPAPEAARWFIDDNEVARGLDVWETAPEGGEHTCRVIVEDEQGRSEAKVTFMTVDPGQSERPVNKPLISPARKGRAAGRKGRKPPRK